ncbi:MAG: hypothetical protein LC685_01855 [Actinobacteria bacterium]|nr:hypothetical protein [Actinomycetota bacterium]
MTLDEALLILNDRLGQEVSAWMELDHDKPLLLASGTLESGHPPPPVELESALVEPPPTEHLDLFGLYRVGDARFDLSEAPVESVGTRASGLTFRLTADVRLIVDW